MSWPQGSHSQVASAEVVFLLEGRPSCCLEVQANDQKTDPKPGDPARSNSYLPEVPYLLLIPALWFIWFPRAVTSGLIAKPRLCRLMKTCSVRASPGQSKQRHQSP